nr:MAG TPA: hypothetical protein [Caudoviricetes sp.]
MTQKTDNFKTSQLAKWSDGQRANGANFSQFINAIATLIDETKTEIINEVNSRPSTPSSTYSDAQAKEVVKAFLNNPTDFNDTQAGKRQTKLNIEYMKFAIVAGQTGLYRKNGNTITVTLNGVEAQKFSNVLNSNILADSSDLPVSSLTANKYILTDAEGARFILDTTTNAIKPALAVIG